MIVVSILIAFFLDAWWDRHQLAGDVNDELVNVTEEVASNLETLELSIRFQRTAIRSIDELVGIIDRTPPGAALVAPDTLILSAFVFNPSYDPSTGAVDALISSGMLSQLDDPVVKKVLTQFRTVVEDIREDELYARQVSNEVILPQFWEEPALRQVLPRVNDLYSRGLDSVSLQAQSVRIANAPGLAVQLITRQAWLLGAIRELEALREDLVEVNARLREQLES